MHHNVKPQIRFKIADWGKNAVQIDNAQSDGIPDLEHDY